MRHDQYWLDILGEPLTPFIQRKIQNCLTSGYSLEAAKGFAFDVVMAKAKVSPILMAIHGLSYREVGKLVRSSMSRTVCEKFGWTRATEIQEVIQ